MPRDQSIPRHLILGLQGVKDHLGFVHMATPSIHVHERSAHINIRIKTVLEAIRMKLPAMLIIRPSTRSLQQARQGELVGFQSTAKHLRKQNKCILRSIMLRIARNQGCPGDQIRVRHFIKQLMGVIQTAALDIHIQNGVVDGEVILKLGRKDVSMNNSGLFKLANLGTFVQQFFVQGPVSFQTSLNNQIQNMEPCTRPMKALAEKVFVWDDMGSVAVFVF
jgi:hypothetical protein